METASLSKEPLGQKSNGASQRSRKHAKGMGSALGQAPKPAERVTLNVFCHIARTVLCDVQIETYNRHCRCDHSQ